MLAERALAQPEGRAASRAEYLSWLATRVTALVALGLYGHRDHVHPWLSAVKPHGGSMETVACPCADLSASAPSGVAALAGARIGHSRIGTRSAARRM